MLKKLVVYFVLLFIAISFTPKAFADGELATSYNVYYDVDKSGITTVTENITLRNLTDRFFAASFTLTIGSTNLSEITASDSQGELPSEVKKEGNKTEIQVTFTQQIAGKDKEYPWKLIFKSTDFAQAQGKTWQISAPKISSLKEFDNYNMTLAIPVEFGDPTSIQPEPKSVKEVGGKIQYFFNKEQLSETGILANFGTEQLFDYSLIYRLRNDKLLPAIAALPLPANNFYQQVIINQIEPKPENVKVDADGNYLAYFKVAGKQSLEVKVQGLAKLFMDWDSDKNQKNPAQLTSEEFKTYTSAKKYWESDNPIIHAKLVEIFQGKEAKSNTQKAKLIHKYVASSLQYDQSRISSEDFQRLGALTTLNNPTKALCSEFTDLFIALARAANIPARMIVGYAYTSNTDLRPLSLQKDVLHAWPEYYDPDNGWIMVDPTWENTTGGVDYFTKLDLNHFVLGVRGVSSEEPVPADDVKVEFSSQQFTPIQDIKVTLVAPDEILSGFPSKAKIRVENSGNFLYPASLLTIDSPNFQPSLATVNLEAVPAFGNFEYAFDLHSKTLWQQADGLIRVTIGDKQVEQKIAIKPFFAYRIFTFAVFGLVGLMVLMYLGIFVLHIKWFRPTGKTVR